jgi:iron complex outermembrane receptor protein
LPGFFQVAASYTGKRWNDLDTLNVPARVEMDAYSLVNLSAGVEGESWALTVFARNIFDERVTLDVADPGYGGLANLQRPPGHAWTTNTNRPTSYGVRYSYRF